MVSDERAQLILVGAIAIGIVLIALTTVLNSAVFTENVAGGSSVEVTGDVQEFERESVRNVRSLVIRVNHAESYHDSASDRKELNATARRNVGNYSRILAETYADTGSVYVNLSYEGTEKFGARVLQDSDDNFSKNNGQSSWTVFSGPAEIGWYVVNVDVENVSQSDPVWFNFTDASGTGMNVSLRQTAGKQLAVRSDIAGGNVSNVTCKPQNGRVLLDVLGGTSYSADCSFNSTEYLEPPYTKLEIEDGEYGYGKYDLVINDSAPVSGMAACASPNDPCRGIAIWSIEFTTHYETASVSYEKTHNVSVYDA
jgi:hypothetical protein